MRRRELSTESESERVQGLGTTVPRLARLVARPIGANCAPPPAVGLTADAAILTVSQRVLQDCCVEGSSS